MTYETKSLGKISFGVLATAAVIAGGFFVANSVLATVVSIVTPAMGGENISTVKAVDGSASAFTSIGDIVITEINSGDFASTVKHFRVVKDDEGEGSHEVECKIKHGDDRGDDSYSDENKGDSDADRNSEDCKKGNDDESHRGEDHNGNYHYQTLVLNAPAGWQFNASGVVTATALDGGNLSHVSVKSVNASAITVKFKVKGEDKMDVLTISGIEAQALTTLSAEGNILNTGIATIAGVTSTTNFGTLSQVAPIVHVPSATIIATKVVCDKESDLPNWAGTGGHVIDATTATAWVTASEGACHLQADWKFQWTPVTETTVDPGDAFVGEAEGWTTFGPTNESGVAQTTITLNGMTQVWMREVLKEGFIPFTFNTNKNSDVSAGMYCNGDGYNYDNYDYAKPLSDGSTTYCVAFNAPKESTSVVTYTITSTSDENGTIDPIGATVVNTGTEKIYTIGAKTGYHVEDVKVDGISVEVATTYTFSNITASHTIAVISQINPTEISCDTGHHVSGGQCVDNEQAQTTGGDNNNGAVLLKYFNHGQVLGASTTDLPAGCSVYLNDHLKVGGKNSVEEVKKLQLFLNENLGLNLPVTGFFGPATFDAVKQFQIANADQILAPWAPFGFSKEKPTGYVYKTTKRWINIMKCKSLNIPLESLKLNEG